MGHQIRIFLTSSDTKALERVLVSDDVVLLHDRSRGPYPKAVESTGFVENGQRQLFFYLARRGDLDSVRTQEVSTQGYWLIDGLRSPVVEFSCSNFEPNKAKPGRLYYNDAFFDQMGDQVVKEQGFSEWAAKLLSKAKRVLTYNKELLAYLGDEAAMMLRNGVKFEEN